jgi:hypothetical protein
MNKALTFIAELLTVLLFMAGMILILAAGAMR